MEIKFRRRSNKSWHWTYEKINGIQLNHKVNSQITLLHLHYIRKIKQKYGVYVKNTCANNARTYRNMIN